MCVAVSMSTRLCSMSTVSQSKPVRAMRRRRDAAERQPGADGRFAGFQGRLMGFGRMIGNLRNEWRYHRDSFEERTGLSPIAKEEKKDRENASEMKAGTSQTCLQATTSPTVCDSTTIALNQLPSRVPTPIETKDSIPSGARSQVQGRLAVDVHRCDDHEKRIADSMQRQPQDDQNRRCAGERAVAQNPANQADRHVAFRPSRGSMNGNSIMQSLPKPVPAFGRRSGAGPKFRQV